MTGRLSVASLATGEAFRLIESAIRDPASCCARIMHDRAGVEPMERWQTRAVMAALSRVTITHGRHCTCGACGMQDWTTPELAPCGMHGPSCRAAYQPLGRPGEFVV